jgi:hypothetical protein
MEHFSHCDCLKLFITFPVVWRVHTYMPFTFFSTSTTAVHYLIYMFECISRGKIVLSRCSYFGSVRRWVIQGNPHIYTLKLSSLFVRCQKPCLHVSW